MREEAHIVRLRALIVLMLWLVVLPVLWTQGFRVELEFSSERPGSYRYTLEAGIDPEATLCLDTALGEVEIPLLPPEGLFPVFLLPCIDSITGVPVMTQKDVRPLPAVGERVEYHVFLQRDGYPLHIRWRLSNVDSARLSDPFEVYVFRLDQQDSAVVDNTAVRELLLQVWYQLPASGIVTPAAGSNSLVAIPRSVRELFLPDAPFVAQGVLWDVTGSRKARVEVRQRRCQLPAPLQPGVYVLQFGQQKIGILVY